MNTGPGRNETEPSREHHRPGQVGREHVGRELRAAEGQAERPGGRVREQRLRHARHALEQDVAAREERGQQAADDLVLAEDDLRRPRRERDPRCPSTPPPRSAARAAPRPGRARRPAAACAARSRARRAPRPLRGSRSAAASARLRSGSSASAGRARAREQRPERLDVERTRRRELALVAARAGRAGARGRA